MAERSEDHANGSAPPQFVHGVPNGDARRVAHQMPLHTEASTSSAPAVAPQGSPQRCGAQARLIPGGARRQVSVAMPLNGSSPRQTNMSLPLAQRQVRALLRPEGATALCQQRSPSFKPVPGHSYLPLQSDADLGTPNMSGLEAPNSEDPLTFDDSSTDADTGYDTAQHGLIGSVPLLGQRKIRVDERHSSVIMVFPRRQRKQGEWVVKGHGSPMRLDEEERRPLEKAAKIFCCDKMLDDPIFDCLRHGIVSKHDYMEAIREKLLRMLQQAGLQVRQHHSIDNDELFLKISLDRDGPMIKHLAEMYQYRMPLSRHVQGHPPKENAMGVEVPGYRSYTANTAEYLEGFRHVDEIRLIYKRLIGLVNFFELVNQNVLTRVFPAAHYRDVKELDKVWADPWMTSRPNYDALEKVRDYFGELVAFYFMWFDYYVYSLSALAGCATIVLLVTMFFNWIGHTWVTDNFGKDFKLKELSQCVFAFFMIVWASFLNKIFVRKAMRFTQKWGVRDTSRDALERDNYDKSLEGSSEVWRNRLITKLCAVMYCFAFICSVALLEKSAIEMADWGYFWLKANKAYVLSVWIKVCSLVWGKAAIRLVQRENHRNEQRFLRGLVWTLSTGKLFTALWPFAYTAFAYEYVNSRSFHSFGRLVVDMYGWKGFPDADVSVPVSMNVTLADVPFLKEYVYNSTSAGGSTTWWLDGCYPIKCDQRSGQCRTNCIVALEEDLLTFYLFDVMCHVLGDLLIPMWLTRRRVEMEIAKAEKKSPNVRVDYTFVEFQAKCHAVAAYEYDSWGGSYTQDFLQLVIGYTLMACFSQVQPFMAIIGVGCLIIEYKILAFRMTNVTCRPWPLYGHGIGVWADVLNLASVLAVSVNVLLAVFVMAPFRGLSFKTKLIVFIIAEKVLLSLKYGISLLLESQPDDVRAIDDYNAEFEKVICAQKDIDTLLPQKTDLFRKISIYLGNSSTESDESSCLSDHEDTCVG